MTVIDFGPRAAVWRGPGTGMWHADIYRATRRVGYVDLATRARLDGHPAPAEDHEAFHTRTAALHWANFRVWELRLGDRIARFAGLMTFSTAELEAAINAHTTDQEDTRS